MGKVCSSLSGREGGILEGLPLTFEGVPLTHPDHKTSMHQVPLSGQRRSLFVGINYCGTANELHGCANDVERMIPAVEKLGFPTDDDHMRVLMDADSSINSYSSPTRSNIMQAIQWLVQGAKDGDALFFHYSGHGGQEPAEGGGFHETLVPLDFENAGMLRDTDLFDVLVKPLPAGGRLTCVLDSCHSAGALDLPYRFVGTEAKIKSALASDACHMVMSKNWHQDVEKWKNGDKIDLLKDVGSMGIGLWNLKKQYDAAKGGSDDGFKVEESEKVGIHVGEVVALTGCRSDQTSADVADVSQQFHLREVTGSSGGRLVIDKARSQGSAGGALTTAFLQTLNDNEGKNISYFDLLESIRRSLADKNFTQVPQVATSLVVDLKQDFALNTLFVPDS